MSKIFLNEAQIKKLLSISKANLRDHAIFHVALATGFRSGDLLRLQRQDVEPNGAVVQTLRVKMQKTGKFVERPLPEACRLAVQGYLEIRKDSNPFLFRAESNNSTESLKPMNRSGLQRIFKRYLARICPQEALKGNACHVTRRSMAKLVSDKAGRIEPATRFLGHTSVASTVAYLDMDGYGKQANQIVGSMPWNQIT